jgi:hypothetical protein
MRLPLPAGLSVSGIQTWDVASLSRPGPAPWHFVDGRPAPAQARRCCLMQADQAALAPLPLPSSDVRPDEPHNLPLENFANRVGRSITRGGIFLTSLLLDENTEQLGCDSPLLAGDVLHTGGVLLGDETSLPGGGSSMGGVFGGGDLGSGFVAGFAGGASGSGGASTSGASVGVGRGSHPAWASPPAGRGASLGPEARPLVTALMPDPSRGGPGFEAGLPLNVQAGLQPGLSPLVSGVVPAVTVPGPTAGAGVPALIALGALVWAHRRRGSTAT